MIIVRWIGSGNFLYLMKLNIMEHILIACGKQEEKTSEVLSLTISPFLLNITPVRKLWIPHDVTSVILVSQTIKRRPYWCRKPVLWHINERKVGVVVRALTSHQCGRGSDPGVDIICGLSFLFVLFQKNQHFQIPIRSGTHGHNSTSFQELLSAMWVNKLQITV